MQLLRRALYLLRSRRLDDDLAEEMAFHEEMKRRELEARGVDSKEAVFAAHRALGNATLAREDVRAVWIARWLDTSIRDVRFGARLLRKNLAFSLIAILTLAVGIGANTALFTLVDAVLIRPLPYADPDRLATFARHSQRGATSADSYHQTGATWLALRERVPALDLAVDGSVDAVNLEAGDHTAHIQQQRVSAGFFRILGVPPVLGREFTPEEDRVDGPAVAVLSHALWVRVFEADPSVLGRRVTLRGEPFTVVGVMPPGFRFNDPTDIWTPLRPSAQGEGGGSNYLLVARLRPGTSWATASGQIASIGSAILREVHRPPPDIQLAMRLVPLQRALTAEVREPLLVLWGAVGMVLLIGCVNIAGLLLARGAARAPELAMRIALGGGRAALMRQLLAESLVLAACGGLAGVVFGYALVRVIAVRLQDVIAVPTAPDARVLAGAALAALLTSVLVGLFPAVQASRTDVRSLLVESGGSAIVGPARRWPGRLLVSVEVALGVVLVVAAGLLLRTVAYLTHLPPGFDATNVITGTMSLQDARYASPAQVNDLFARSLERLRRTPGVEHAAVALSLPYERALNEGWRFEGAADGQPEPLSLTYVTPDYFRALRIPVRGGRGFTERDTDGASPVVIVNEAFVRRYSRDRDPVGRQLRLGDRRVEIVGVVGDIQQRVTFGTYGPVSTMPAAYKPAGQFGGEFALVHTWFEPSWIVRAAGPRAPLVAAIQRAVEAVDPHLPFNRFRTLDDIRDEAVIVDRIQAGLLGGLAAIALLLCALGVYGLMAHAVTERQREFGVRVALGATPSQVVRTAAKPAIAIGVSGVALGLLLAIAAARVMEGLVFGVPVRDPATFAIAGASVLATACLAALIPALRTLRLNVIAVLNAR